MHLKIVLKIGALDNAVRYNAVLWNTPVPRRQRTYYVYILSSKSGTLYTGIINSVFNRVIQHRNKETPGFTSKYDVNQLVYYEILATC